MLRKGDFVLNSFAPSLITNESSVSVDSELYSKHDDKRIRTQSPNQTNDRKSMGSSSMLTKLYDENAELAETLANTQAELARANTKLKLLNYVDDHCHDLAILIPALVFRTSLDDEPVAVKR